MNKLQKIYAEYEDILLSYDGDNTNWKEKSIELRNKIFELKLIKFSSTKNSDFNNFVKKKLLQDITEEYNRVEKNYK